MTRYLVSLLVGASLGAGLGWWSVRAELRRAAPAARFEPSSAPQSPESSSRSTPAHQTMPQLLQELRRLTPDAQLHLRAWRDGRITTEMANALGLSAEEEARLNAAVSDVADEMARASHERVTVRTTKDSLTLIVPAFSPTGEAKNGLIAKFREAIGEERTRLLLAAAGSHEQLARECRFFGTYEQVMELQTADHESDTLWLNESAERTGDVVDEHGRSLGHRYVMQHLRLLHHATAQRTQLERFAGPRWRQLVPENIAARLQ